MLQRYSPAALLASYDFPFFWLDDGVLEAGLPITDDSCKASLIASAAIPSPVVMVISLQGTTRVDAWELSVRNLVFLLDETTQFVNS